MKLSGSFEPLVTVKSSATRQARRKARRAEAKTAKRTGKAVAYEVAPAKAPPVPAQAMPASSAEAPLPRGRALALPATGLLARVDAWFVRLIARAAPARAPAVSQEALAEQMLALRSELALVQGRLDRMIKAVSPN